MRIKMKLLSDAIPGSGEGIAGIIDSDIVYDEFGIPYIPAKRIKGILRESARDLLDVGKLSQARIDALFGIIGNDKGTDLKISDGFIADYEDVRTFLKAVKHNYKKAYTLFNPEAVLGYYSYTRSQTTIAENGTAQEDTLRTFRILRRGLEFYFDIVCPHEYLEDFNNILKVTRAFGTSRTRGTGEIRLSFLDGESPESLTPPTPEEESQFQDNDLCQIKLNIHNVAQLLVTSQVGKTQESEDYIPGSFLLGALAGRYIAGYNLPEPHKDENFQAIFLNGKVQFSDAYPNPAQDRVYLPYPKSIVKEKDKDHYFDLTDANKIDKIISNKIQTKGNIGPYVHIGGNDVEYVTPETEVEYHHQRPSLDRGIGHATEEAGEFFQFNVLKPDQHFQAHIIGEYRYLKELFSLLQQDNVLYLGKSKTAQYGKCACEAEIALRNTSSKIWEKGKKAVITLISDMILRNENGMTAADPELLVKEIRQFRGLPDNSNEIELVAAFIDSKKIGGYLSVWNMPKIQAVALAAGSELVCQNNSGQDIPADEVESHAFGCRTEEGFGKIRIDWHNKTDIGKVEKAESSYSMPEIPTKARELVKKILDRELENTAINYATEQFNSFEGTKIKNSFIGRLKLIISRAHNFNELNENIKFSKSAFEQLKKLKNALHLAETRDDDGKDILIVNLPQFTGKFLQIQKPNKIPDLSALMSTLGIEPNYLQQDEKLQLKLYKLFANHFLTLARLNKRNNKEAQNG